MERLVYNGDRRFELVEAAPQPLAADEARIAVGAAGICGSDVHGYVGLNDRRKPGTVMGHEVAGRVVEVGDEVVEVEPGALVAVWPIVACGSCPACLSGRSYLCETRRLYGCVPELPGGFATEMVVPAASLVALPPGVGVELGALVEPLAVGLHAARIAGGHLGTVAVIGGGPIGIAAAVAAIRHGADSVSVVEPLPARREALEGIGLSAVAPEAAPEGVDTVFECVGNDATVNAALAASRPGGAVAMIGVAEPQVTISVVQLVIEERRLLGSSAYTLDDFRDAAVSLGDSRFDLATMIQARATLAATPATFRAYAERETTAIKTLVVPGE